jgi:hypothetical protein
MSNFSDYLEAAVLNSSLRGVAFPVPSGTHLALFTTDPTDAGTGSEATGAWYGRQSIGTSSGWTAPADSAGGKMSQNANIIAFNPVTGSSITVTHIGIYDAGSGGNLLYQAALAASKTLQIGDVLQFAAGSIQVTTK